MVRIAQDEIRIAMATRPKLATSDIQKKAGRTYASTSPILLGIVQGKAGRTFALADLPTGSVHGRKPRCSC